MANPLVTPNMSLIEPAIGNTLSPTWASDLNMDLSIIDQHNHEPGSGVQITPAGLNINVDLPFQDNNATGLRSTRYVPLSLGSLTGTDLGCIVIDSSSNLYYVNGAGLQIQITNSSGIVGSPGNISGLTSPASASYVSGTETFVWQSNSNVAANMDFATAILRYPSTGYPTPSGIFIALEVPSSLASGYSLILPNGLPGSNQLLQLSSAGQMFASNTISGAVSLSSTLGVTGATTLSSTLDVSGATHILNTLHVNGTITGDNALSLTGGAYLNTTANAFLYPNATAGILVYNASQTTSRSIVTSFTPATNNSLDIIRGVVPSAGNPVTAGNGYTVVHTAGTGFYTITFSIGFADVPSITVTPINGSSGYAAYVVTANANSFTVGTFQTPTTSLSDSAFSFIAIGERNS